VVVLPHRLARQGPNQSFRLTGLFDRDLLGALPHKLARQGPGRLLRLAGLLSRDLVDRSISPACSTRTWSPVSLRCMFNQKVYRPYFRNLFLDTRQTSTLNNSLSIQRYRVFLAQLIFSFFTNLSTSSAKQTASAAAYQFSCFSK
jgi:hypothetical protein